MAQVRMIVYDSRLDQMFAPGGEVYDKVQDWSNETSRRAKVLAPMRSGAMKRSIRADTRKLSGKNAIGRIRIQVPYASYVLEGTRTPITSTGFPVVYMRLRPGNGHGARLAMAVRGQRANNFAAKALRDVMG